MSRKIDHPDAMTKGCIFASVAERSAGGINGIINNLASCLKATHCARAPSSNPTTSNGMTGAPHFFPPLSLRSWWIYTPLLPKMKMVTE